MLIKKKFKTRAVIMRDSLDEVANVLEDVLNHFHEEGYEADWHTVESRGVLMGFLIVGQLTDSEDSSQQLNVLKQSLFDHLEEVKKVHSQVQAMSPVEAKGMQIMDAVLSKVSPTSAEALKRKLPEILGSMLGGQPATILMELAEGLDSSAVRHSSWHSDPSCIVPEACRLIAAQLREMSKGSLS